MPGQSKHVVANRYFEERMKQVFINRVCTKGIETFEKYLSYRYRDNCYYYSGYAIMGLENSDYLVRGEIRLKGNWIWGKGGYPHGWVEFEYLGRQYVFDSMCKGVVLKDEWYEEFKPEVYFKYSKRELLESMLSDAKYTNNGCYAIYDIQNVNLPNYNYHTNYYIDSVYWRGKLLMKGNKVAKFIAYSLPSG